MVGSGVELAVCSFAERKEFYHLEFMTNHVCKEKATAQGYRLEEIVGPRTVSTGVNQKKTFRGRY